ncbi:MAG TPA: hypothetical protein VD969_21630 [Symbiobacteriaceae bacterium]|nr:hypothetical protein [Symbiobacteriaceae bacterium]
MSAENQPVNPGDGSVHVRTPAKFYTTQEALAKIPGAPPPMAGGQVPGECSLTAHQFICVSGEVFTTVTPGPCTTKVVCLNGGVGSVTCPPGTPQPCSFKFFQNLCVEVDVTFVAEAMCRLNDVQCLGVEDGPCPPPPPPQP